MKTDLVDFLDETEKLYINSNTGKGKTLLLALFSLFFIDSHPNFKGIANFHLNIFDKETGKNKFQFSKYSLLPFNELEKGNWIIIIDDIIAVKQDLQNFGSILGTLSRKLNVYCYISMHYYTHLIRENRQLFQFEIIPMLTKIRNKKLTYESKAKLECYIPDTYDLQCKFHLYNLLELVEGNYSCENVYVKGNLYDTYETVAFSSERKIIQEIANWSNNLDDIEKNVNIITKSRTRQKYLVNQVRKIVNV